VNLLYHKENTELDNNKSLLFSSIKKGLYSSLLTDYFLISKVLYIYFFILKRALFIFSFLSKISPQL